MFLFINYNSEVEAQTTSEFVLPTNVNDVIKLSLDFEKNSELLGYDELAVFIKNEENNYRSNPIQGKHIVEEHYVVFKPYLPFEKGTEYVIRIKNKKSENDLYYQSFQIGKQKIIQEAKVISIYPSADKLPENLLRFYIYFNTPMQQGQAINHIQLIDEAGNVDKHAFMTFKQELWSADGKRLTIFFDPGRLKRGVSTNMQHGPALIDGGRYSLKISRAWTNVYGQEISLETTKEFEVVNAYRRHIKVQDWILNKPKENSYENLIISFDRIFDHALLQSMIEIEDRYNNILEGKWELLENERLIQFHPKKKWSKGKYRITIDSRLEDIAGNNLQNLLDYHKSSVDNNIRHHHHIDLEL